MWKGCKRSWRMEGEGKSGRSKIVGWVGEGK